MLDSYKDQDQYAIHKKSLESLYSKYFRTPQLNKLMPDLRGKTVLDVPCSLGNQSVRLFEDGVKYIIGSDIVAEQVQYMDKRLQKLNIPKDRYELHVHDSKMPKKFSDREVDFALVLHLLCFADDQKELEEMCKCIYVNMKEGAQAIFRSCHPINQERKQLYEILNNEKIKEYRHPEEVGAPGLFHSVIEGGFNLRRNVWHVEDYVRAMKAVGFKSVKVHPMECDPNCKEVTTQMKEFIRDSCTYMTAER